MSKFSIYPPNLELKEAKQCVNPWLGGVSHFIAYRKEEGGGLERVKVCIARYMNGPYMQNKYSFYVNFFFFFPPSFYGQRSVMAALTNICPWSIILILYIGNLSMFYLSILHNTHVTSVLQMMNGMISLFKSSMEFGRESTNG